MRATLRRIGVACAGFAICALALVGGDGSARGAALSACGARPTAAGYGTRVAKALAAKNDAWGDKLLATKGGPTFEQARALLQPLFWARGPGGKPLTASGAYYVPMAQPESARGAGSVVLHVADGSQILSEHVGGRSLTVLVGSTGRERFGSCLARLGQATLGGGYLPILETRYRDAAGARYRQESFAARPAQTRSLVSFVRLAVDARRAASAVRVRFASSLRVLRRDGDTLFAGSRAVLAFSGGAAFDGSGVVYRVPRGTIRTLYVEWLDPPARPASPIGVGQAAYAAARGSVAEYWRERLAEGAAISVPDGRVENALRALLVQDLELTWRYSIGNAYEEFSFPESVDVAEVLGELGFQTVARSILRTSLTRKATPYPDWKKGERLVAAAELYRLSGDRSLVDEVTPVLHGYVASLGRQVAANARHLLSPERYSSDIASSVYGLHTQTVVWQGLLGMSDAWTSTGRTPLAATSSRLAARLERALRAAVRASERRLPDGTLFVPVILLGGERPYDSLTEQRLGSYWNLVMPYALASGFFAPGGVEARGILAYMLAHGSRLAGLVRAGAYALYGAPAYPASGTDEVYGLNVARFLADNDQADQLDLSLVGQLAAAMTPGTFVSGEAASVAPLDGTGYRSMYLPPNGASDAAFLETVRSLLVHETRNRLGSPVGLQLAFATPRSWLEPGKRIAVRDAPTSFGPVSYTLVAGRGAVQMMVDEPQRTPPGSVALRLRLPAGAVLRSVTLGGRPFGHFDARTGTIELPRATGPVTLVARYVDRSRA